MIYLEDVFVTGYLAEKCGYKRHNQSGFYTVRANPCKKKAPIVVMHRITPQLQYSTYILFQKTNLDKKCNWFLYWSAFSSY